MRGIPELRAAPTFPKHHPSAGCAVVVKLGTLTDRVVNGGFDADTDWTKGANWTIAAGKASHAAGSTAALVEAVGTIVANEYYLVEYTIGDCTAGTLTLYLGVTPGVAHGANGTYAEVVRANGTTIGFVPSNDFDGSVDDVKSYHLGENQGTSGHYHVITKIDAGYNAPPTNSDGYLLIADSAGVIFRVDITGAGHKPFKFDDGLWRTADSPMAVVLSMGDKSITGKLNLKAY